MKEKKSMGGSMLPKESWEKAEGQLEAGREKYASEFGAAREYDEMNNKLVGYQKKNKMKYY